MDLVEEEPAESIRVYSPIVRGPVKNFTFCASYRLASSG
jgi:hypothetical protein